MTFTAASVELPNSTFKRPKTGTREQQAGLARDFNHEFTAVMGRLAETPLIYPVVYREVRRAILHRFPFLVWYQIDGSVVRVLACTHGKADPRKVRARLR